MFCHIIFQKREINYSFKYQLGGKCETFSPVTMVRNNYWQGEISWMVGQDETGEGDDCYINWYNHCHGDMEQIFVGVVFLYAD